MPPKICHIILSQSSCLVWQYDSYAAPVIRILPNYVYLYILSTFTCISKIYLFLSYAWQFEFCFEMLKLYFQAMICETLLINIVLNFQTAKRVCSSPCKLCVLTFILLFFYIFFYYYLDTNIWLFSNSKESMQFSLQALCAHFDICSAH